MGCTECADGNHAACIERNSTKDYPDCTCQHRVGANDRITGEGKEVPSS